ncbi:MAG: hypothetical protein WBC93_12685, partial [Sulfitobacter sp.]
MKKWIILSISFLFVIIALSSCVTDQMYRTNISDTKICSQIELNSDNFENNSINDNQSQCAFQTHKIATASQWAQVPNAERISEPDTFNLSFIEMSENSNSLFNHEQLNALKSNLKRNSQNYVITYVHGWRHDSEIGDTDVQKFRVLLAYSRSFLNTRCVKLNRYCNASLTGVFVGWRGRTFPEPVDRKKSNAFLNGIYTILAAPTLWSRKKQSENFAKGVQPVIGEIIDGIKDELTLNTDSYIADKHLVFGHSLGGNMLATFMQPKVMAAVNDHTLGTTMKPIVGDLVVLLNPASEASKWTSFQEAIRSRSGLSKSDVWGAGSHYAEANLVDRKN